MNSNKSIYIHNVRLEANSTIEYGLQKIQGIGRKYALDIATFLGVSKYLKISELSEAQINRIVSYIIDNITVKSDLVQSNKEQISKLVSIKCYRGVRHGFGLPVRGQRTHTNRKTQRKLSPRRYKVYRKN